MVAPLSFYCTMTIGALSVPCAVRTFGYEKEVYWREASTGLNRLAYYLGKVLADIPYIAILAFLFMAPMVLIAPWRAPLEGLYAYTLCVMALIFALGYLLSALLDAPENAALAGVVVAVLANLFGGFVPMIGNNGKWAYTHWAQRALMTLELQQGYGLTMAQFNSFVNSEWEAPNYGFDLGMLVVIAIIINVGAFVVLAVRRHDKQR